MLVLASSTSGIFLYPLPLVHMLATIVAPLHFVVHYDTKPPSDSMRDPYWFSLQLVDNREIF